MTREQWRKIKAAREALGLPDQASLAEIKQAFRRLSKIHHPDLALLPAGEKSRMHEITEAYQVLLEYGAQYPLPLAPTEKEPLSDEDWWMERFGHDPLWSKG